MAKQKAAPKFLNLLVIKLPAGGIASIAHRISGVLMFLAIPVLAWALNMSIRSEEGYSQLLATLEHPMIRLALVVLVWALSHHLFAGIRHLFLDIDIGVQKNQARITGWMVNLAGIAVAGLYLVCLL